MKRLALVFVFLAAATFAFAENDNAVMIQACQAKAHDIGEQMFVPWFWNTVPAKYNFLITLAKRRYAVQNRDLPEKVAYSVGDVTDAYSGRDLFEMDVFAYFVKNWDSIKELLTYEPAPWEDKW